MKALGEAFFRQDPVECARRLVGCVFEWDGCSGRIVETEAYRSEGDPACHIFFRPSAGTFLAEHEAGVPYVYLNYGVHWLFNFLVKAPDSAGFVLLRALEPLEGVAEMIGRRGTEHLENLCSGPGKLTQALGIDGRAHGAGILGSSQRKILAGGEVGLVAGPRIGISKGKELPWRFTEMGSRFVSR